MNTRNTDPHPQLNSVGAIILAGGKSRRMGMDKSMLLVNGRPAIEHILSQLEPLFEQILISANDKDKYAYLGRPIVQDKQPGAGPIMGIVSALEQAKSNINFVVACDIPVIDKPFLNKMLEGAEKYDAVIPVSDGGHLEPLFAIYNKSLVPHMQDMLKKGTRKIIDTFPGRNIRHIKMKDTSWLINLNTSQDYKRFLELRKEHSK